MEQWRPVAGVPHYEVSNLGRVRNLGRTIHTSNNQLRRYRGGIIVPAKNQHGHLKVLLIVRPGVKIPRYVHDLVAQAFIGPRPEGHEIAHGDGNPANNEDWNLRYATPKENAADKIRHGTHLARARHPSARLTEADIIEVRRRLAAGDRQKDVASTFNVSRATIGSIAVGRSWREGSK